MTTEDDAPRPRPALEIGQPLDLLSAAELEARIAALRAEIARLEAARDAKRAATAAAEAFFRK
ncbi:DUF1192 domain-containing protein [Methylocystis echinoides]|uniref:DUF1192 domain-containing protein n=1 Tax=Methylocystis echinoides TaxID=29468 RepID=A0A9W6GSQ2_9HYPH|nr:DUF1192 domain-containing protein [Methylocystis echinoides]GLI92200.1 hypothetical protein LMG27198_11920 [Methylocystis echinoides]